MGTELQGSATRTQSHLIWQTFQTQHMHFGYPLFDSQKGPLACWQQFSKCFKIMECKLKDFGKGTVTSKGTKNGAQTRKLDIAIEGKGGQDFQKLYISH